MSQNTKRSAAGSVAALFRYPEKGKPAVCEEELCLIAGSGIAGDCHADGGDRQVSLFTQKQRAWMEEQEIQGFCFRKYKENILLADMDPGLCRPGALLRAGEAVLELTGSMKGCHRKLCALAQSGRPCRLAGSCLFARVRCGGRLRVGDTLYL